MRVATEARSALADIDSVSLIAALCNVLRGDLVLPRHLPNGVKAKRLRNKRIQLGDRIGENFSGVTLDYDIVIYS